MHQSESNKTFDLPNPLSTSVKVYLTLFLRSIIIIKLSLTKSSVKFIKSQRVETHPEPRKAEAESSKSSEW